MIAYTKNTDAINEGLYDIIQAEFKPIPVLFQSDLHGPSEFIKIWLQENRWISNHSDGETREYEYLIQHIKTIDKDMDRNVLKLEFTNYADRMLQLLNNNRSYGSTVWHRMTVEVIPAWVLDEINEEPVENIYTNDFMVTITRGNFW